MTLSARDAGTRNGFYVIISAYNAGAMASPSTRRVHVFDVVKARNAFLDGIPSIVATAVGKARALAPNHPAFAIGVMAHFIAHHDLALASGDGFYQEDHLATQCRGTFVLREYGRRYLCFLASGHKIDDFSFKVHRKGPMTLGAPPEQGVLFALDESVETEGKHFFLVVEGFAQEGHEWRKIHLVWGHLSDHTTLVAEFSHSIGQTDLGLPVYLPVLVDLPPIEDAVPYIDVESEDE